MARNRPWRRRDDGGRFGGSAGARARRGRRSLETAASEPAMLFEITIVAGRVQLSVGPQVDLHSFLLEDVKGELAHWPAEEVDIPAVAEAVERHDSRPVDIGRVCARVDDGADHTLYVDGDERRAWLIAQQREPVPSESALRAFLDAHRIAWHDDDPHWLGATGRMRFGLPALVVEATRRGGVYVPDAPLLSLPVTATPAISAPRAAYGPSYSSSTAQPLAGRSWSERSQTTTMFSRRRRLRK